MRKDIRVAVLGDDGVGKTSLINYLIENWFVETVPDVLPEVCVPASSMTAGCSASIVDTSATTQEQSALASEILKADAVVLVYAVNDMPSFANMKQRWLPYVTGFSRSIPIILAGNKIETRGENLANENLENDMIPIMAKYMDVETCIECSAKTGMNVDEVFYFACKAAIYPTPPLYDTKAEALKPPCIEALTRIFKILDKDNNGSLGDEEMVQFQGSVFDSPLPKEELEDVKKVLVDMNPDSVDKVGLTLVGFLLLHALFIQRGRLEIVWNVLKAFGYGEDLLLREDYLYPRIEVPPGCSVELSSKGITFLVNVFKKHDKDKDGALSEIELDDLFSTTPGNPWLQSNFPEGTVTDDLGNITLQGFLAQWSMTTLFHYQTTLAYLAYFGFSEDRAGAFKIAGPRSLDRKSRKSSSDMIVCYVVGSQNSGKTSLIKSLVHKPFSSAHLKDTDEYSAINTIEVGPCVKQLILKEVSAESAKSFLSNSENLDKCDVVCLLFDANNRDSFAYIADLAKNTRLNSIPVVMVSTKADLPAVRQRYHLQPNELCLQRNWLPPTQVSILANQASIVFKKLAEVALNPNLSMSLPVKSHARGWIYAASLICTVIIASYGVKKYYSIYQKST